MINTPPSLLGFYHIVNRYGKAVPIIERRTGRQPIIGLLKSSVIIPIAVPYIQEGNENE